MSGSWAWPPGWQKIRAEVFRVKGRQCWRCGAYANSVDHIVPVVLGGGTTWPTCGRPARRATRARARASVTGCVRGARAR
ncbi:MAG: HNH endonuclease [Trebonia sp.]